MYIVSIKREREREREGRTRRDVCIQNPATLKACKQLYKYTIIDRRLQKRQIVLNVQGQRWSVGILVPLVSIHPLSRALLWRWEEAETEKEESKMIAPGEMRDPSTGEHISLS